MDRVQANGKIRKRKAESQDNERLHKRLSLLNLERNGERLYVPVEHPTTPMSMTSRPKSPALQPQQPQPRDDDVMQLDDTKHKVYIYDLDAELSDSESSDDGKLVFLPDIQKHLRETRIPPMVLANSEGELAGHNNQLVLYNIPSSLTVPEEQDSVRKAIIETRARARAVQEQKLREQKKTIDARDWYKHMEETKASGAPMFGFARSESMEEMKAATPMFGFSQPEPMDGEPTVPISQGPMDDDPDAMDLG